MQTFKMNDGLRCSCNDNKNVALCSGQKRQMEISTKTFYEIMIKRATNLISWIVVLVVKLAAYVNDVDAD